MALIKRMSIGIIISMIGLAFAAVAYYKEIKPVNLKIQGSVLTSGIITSDETTEGYITGENPVVEYTVYPDNEIFKENVSQSGRITRFKSGEHVSVYYSIKDPSDVMLADPGVMYYNALGIGLFGGVILFIFGIPLMILGILNRDSFFDISGQLKNGISPAAGKSVKINAVIIVLLWIMKIFFDIPACIHQSPYLIISFIIMFIVNIGSFLIVLRISDK